MRVLTTGAAGFVGRWLIRELSAAGHEPVGSDERVDVRDRAAVAGLVERMRPDAVVHLAAISFAPDAASDPSAALEVNVGGTLNLLEAVVRATPRPVVLVASSSEVYARPVDDRPIDEGAPLGPRGTYGLTKVGQESLALAIARRERLRLTIVRPFNHTGPGQRPSFVVPALSRRIADLRAGRAASIRVGNLDVRRDIGDVRDVVRAYRLLLEAMTAGDQPGDEPVFNIATGRAVAIREVVERLAELMGVDPVVEVDPALVRPDDPPVIRGDATRLRTAIGWQPQIPLEQTLADVAAEAAASVDSTGSVEAPSGAAGS